MEALTPVMMVDMVSTVVIPEAQRAYKVELARQSKPIFGTYEEDSYVFYLCLSSTEIVQEL